MDALPLPGCNLFATVAITLRVMSAGRLRRYVTRSVMTTVTERQYDPVWYGTRTMPPKNAVAAPKMARGQLVSQYLGTKRLRTTIQRTHFLFLSTETLLWQR